MNARANAVLWLFLAFGVPGATYAARFEFTGTVAACTATCNSFAFLRAGSQVNGVVELDDVGIADGIWIGADVRDVSIEVFNPAAAPFGPSTPPSPVTDNPFVLDQTSDGGALVAANGQSITNPRGTFTSAQSMGTVVGSRLAAGFVDFWVTQGVLSNNGAVITLRLDAQCPTTVAGSFIVPPCFEVRIFEQTVFIASGSMGVPTTDGDDDGLGDDSDNCPNVPNPDQADEDADALGNVCDNCPMLANEAQADLDADALGDACDNCRSSPNTDQRDTDADAYGNVCDADLDNDCAINFVDLGLLKADFFRIGDLSADFDGDGVVNFIDLAVLKSTFFTPPGPGASGLPSLCDPECGNGSVNAPEECDDGNETDGDGCSSACQVELGWICPVPQPRGPSLCLECMFETFDDETGGLTGWTLFHAGPATLDWGTTDSGSCADQVPLGNFTGGSGTAACVEDFGFVPDQVDAYLCSPPQNLSVSAETQLAFLYNYQLNTLESQDRFEVLVGLQMPTAQTVTTYSSTFVRDSDAGNYLAAPGLEQLINLSAFDGQPDVWICFRYAALLDRYVQVDNVVIGPPACATGGVASNPGPQANLAVPRPNSP